MLKRITRGLPAVLLIVLFTACPISNTRQISGIEDTDASELELKVHSLVNEYRSSKNLPALTMNQLILDIAREHSKDMADGTVPFSHEGFADRAERISEQLDTSGVAENVAYNYGYSNPGEIAVEGWIESAGHRANMEGSYNVTGIGIVENNDGYYYFTQLFAYIP